MVLSPTYFEKSIIHMIEELGPTEKDACHAVTITQNMHTHKTTTNLSKVKG